MQAKKLIASEIFTLQESVLHHCTQAPQYLGGWFCAVDNDVTDIMCTGGRGWREALRIDRKFETFTGANMHKNTTFIMCIKGTNQVNFCFHYLWSKLHQMFMSNEVPFDEFYICFIKLGAMVFFNENTKKWIDFCIFFCSSFLLFSWKRVTRYFDGFLRKLCNNFHFWFQSRKNPKFFLDLLFFLS